jgi:hypothetical protein
LLLARLRDAVTIAVMVAHAALALSLAVRVYNGYGVPAATLDKAHAAIDRILKDAEMRITWEMCPCSEPVGPAELVVRIAAAPAAIDPASLGFSFVDVDRRAGTLATVFADRIRLTARIAGVDEGELLGRAMAHEIAHLLLGTHDHARSGLMRGRWDARDLQQNQPWDWMLSRNEGATMREALVRRRRDDNGEGLRVELREPPEIPLGDAE